MKIYNEIVYQVAGDKLIRVSEDSFEYCGEITECKSSGSDIVEDITRSPETVNVQILEKDINCQEERIEKENAYIRKFDTIFNGYNKKISAKISTKKKNKIKLQDLPCVKPQDLEYDLYPVFSKDLERRQEEFKIKVLKIYKQMVLREKIPENKKILEAYLENLEICS